jgi:hypothetical protein
VGVEHPASTRELMCAEKCSGHQAGQSLSARRLGLAAYGIQASHAAAWFADATGSCIPCITHQGC